jgi:hypothetical protein
MRACWWLLVLAAFTAFGAEPSPEFVFSRTTTRPFQGPGGTRITYSLVGNVLTKDQKTWGTDVFGDDQAGRIVKTVSLTEDQARELRAAVATASQSSELRTPPQGNSRNYVEYLLQTTDRRGKGREVVVQSAIDRMGRPRGPEEELLRNATADPTPAAKSFAAMASLGSLLSRLSGDRAFPDGHSL